MQDKNKEIKRVIENINLTIEERRYGIVRETIIKQQILYNIKIILKTNPQDGEKFAEQLVKLEKDLLDFYFKSFMCCTGLITVGTALFIMLVPVVIPSLVLIGALGTILTMGILYHDEKTSAEDKLSIFSESRRKLSRELSEKKSNCIDTKSPGKSTQYGCLTSAVAL